MDDSRLNKKINNWAEQTFRRHRVCKNSNFRIYSQFEPCGIASLFNDTDIDKQPVNNAIHVKLMSDFKQKWNEDLHSDTTRRNGPGDVAELKSLTKLIKTNQKTLSDLNEKTIEIIEQQEEIDEDIKEVDRYELEIQIAITKIEKYSQRSTSVKNQFA
ncbi:unnamed protein product [Mytilus coruscus]|uniref:Uncharacterized protein n=1 Tax=Mytilus coruscus TaxID=42192 RepID=A0A6J8EH49_MYTCO|nr:unnamed protein product [Mytilus coruscus]